MSNAQSPVQTLPAIQIIRGLAAMLVALGHSMIELPKLDAFHRATYTVSLNYGFGVDLFFVISGFIMVHTAGGGFGSPVQQRRFIFARVARIGPLYWIVTSIYLTLALAAPNTLNAVAIDAQTIIGSYLFLPLENPRGVVLPLVAVGWTLNYEMLFYAIFTVAMFLPKKSGLACVIAMLVALAGAGWVFDFASAPLSFWTDSILVEFAFGMMLALIAGRLAGLPSWLSAVLLAAGLTGFIAPHLFPSSTMSLDRLVLSGIPATLIVAGAISTDLQGPAPRLPILAAIGNSSYSLYLTHLFVIRGMRIMWNMLSPNGLSWLFCPSALAVSVLVGLLVAYTVELPLHRWAKIKSRRLFVAPSTVRNAIA